MDRYNFNNKTFLLVDNSKEGTVNHDTVFKYKQEGNLVTADYHGGTIVYGKIIALLEGDQLHMRYQCLTIGNELKSGKAIASISTSEEGKLKLSLEWEWLEGTNEKGTSEYLEM